MTKQIINLGQTANDRTGDPLRVAFQKVNENFDELYATAAADLQLPSQAGNNGKFLKTNGSTLSWDTINLGDSIGDFSITERTIASTTQGNVIIKALGPGGAPSAPPFEYDWAFTSGGRLQMPVGGDIVDSNGTSVLEQGPEDRLVNGDYSVILDSTGAIRHRNTRTVMQGITVVTAGQSGIVYSGSAWQTGFKLVIVVETRLDNNTDDVDHTQVCEALIAATYNTAADPVMSVYGVTYTSPSPLATFTVQRTGAGNGVGTIEVVATNIQTQYNLQVSVQAVQFGSAYD